MKLMADFLSFGYYVSLQISFIWYKTHFMVRALQRWTKAAHNRSVQNCRELDVWYVSAKAILFQDIAFEQEQEFVSSA